MAAIRTTREPKLERDGLSVARHSLVCSRSSLEKEDGPLSISTREEHDVGALVGAKAVGDAVEFVEFVELELVEFTKAVGTVVGAAVGASGRG